MIDIVRINVPKIDLSLYAMMMMRERERERRNGYGKEEGERKKAGNKERKVREEKREYSWKEK